MSERVWRDYEVTALSIARSPITHMEGAEGNEAVLARELVVSTSGHILRVPVLSGNALRHRTVRAPGAEILVELLGIDGRLGIPELNFLWHGGNLTESTQNVDLRRVARIKESLPLIDLLGGSLPDQILSGRLHVSRGMLICEENRARIGAWLARAFRDATDDELELGRLLPATRYVSRYAYTRGDVRAQGSLTSVGVGVDVDVDATVPGRGERADGKLNLMPFAGESIIAGAAFLHSYSIRRGDEIHLGALLSALDRWQATGGSFGGQAARGHGALETAIHIDPQPVTEDGGRAGYRAYVEQESERARELLAELFAPRKKKAAKPA